MRTNLVLPLCACLATACAQKVPPKPVAAVRAEVVTAAAANGQVVYSAVAQPKTTTPLAFRGPGYVSELMKVTGTDGRPRELGEGDRVKRGDVVARLRDSEYKDKVGQAAGQVAAARAAAEKARLDYERATRLFATQSVTKPEMEAATAQKNATLAQLGAAESALAEAKVALKDTALVAPVDGDVLKKSAEAGAFMGPGMPAFVIGDVSTVKVVLGLPDVALSAVKLGMSVETTTDALPGKTFHAKVSRIAAAADPVTRNFDVEVEIPNGERLWKPGMIASVSLGASARSAAIPLLPLTAFVPSPGGKGKFAVMVAEGTAPSSRALVRDVELGDVVGNRVAVVRGLSAGERVITLGASLLADGEKVEVLPTEQP